MDDRKIDQIQQEILKEIDNESRIEKEIISSAETIAGHLMISGKCNAEIDDKQYSLAYRLIEKGKFKMIFMTAANINVYKIAGSKYTPFIMRAEVDSNYSMKDNIKATVEAFIRHVTGRIKPEILENENSYEVNKIK